MIQPEAELTPQQRALQQLALRQMQAVQETLQRLLSVTDEQADREAVADALDWLSKADYTLRGWLGGCPERFREDIEAAESEL